MTTPDQPDSPGDTRLDPPGGDGSGPDAEATRAMSAEPAPSYDPDAEATVQIPPVAGPPQDDVDDGGSSGSRRRLLVAGAAVVGLLAALYVGDLLLSATNVPRGVTVAGVEIGGMNRLAAQETLGRELGPRVSRPVTLVAGSGPDARTTTIDPRTAGLDLDVAATIDEAGEQPLNPFTRLSSLFADREIAPISKGNPVAIGQAVDAARPQLDRPSTEGTIRFEGDRPIPVPSVPGAVVDSRLAPDVVFAHWLDAAPVALPVTEQPVTVTQDGLDTAMREVATPAVAGPAYVIGDGKNATLSPEEIGTFLRFDPDGSGGLTPRVDVPAAEKVAGRDLASTEAEPKDATFAFEGAAATVVPAVTGRAIDYPKTFEGLVEALGREADPAPPTTFTPPPVPPGATPAAPPPANGRAVNAVYTTTPPKVTTEALQALGPATVIGEFQSGGFAADSGQNIKRVAEIVNGATIKPGETFSLNGFTGPRDAGQGFVEAGIIDDGVPGRGIGGGISQFATTLYNASYFAGLQQVEHKEHSYYISRYPAGREATVFEGAIDLKFRNDGDTPVLIRTQWTPASIKVQIYGQKRYDVTSQTGPRTNPVAPGTRDLSDNPRCKPSKGVGGFTITDTRVLKDVRTGETKSEPRTVRYNPEPEITCNNR
ncbi:VanW family protein [Actinomycetospora sp. NBRC 106378]|uniref:VanW family protein n=1 Tax=Actinomycetospora sp. NBRC 106378 TaxID=3032208 RepID=UPI0024A34CA3|nr:VanW family protein [Actinomycetospora sp. NBRC 106378]GLZ54988.1 vanomycin resistance protein VanB [Actinomycetospora sp. NBRC 106378]